MGTVRFAIKIKNVKLFCFCYGMVRGFLPKNGDSLVFADGLAIRVYKSSGGATIGFFKEIITFY